MRLEKASAKAVKYACMNFHYAKRVPVNYFAFSVFENNTWCGVIVFGAGIRGIEKPYNLAKNTVYELVRVALNGKQSKTSKAVSLAVKLFKKYAPMVKLLVSYADSDEGHIGGIYQAMNWYYEQSKITSPTWIDPITQKKYHQRRVDAKGYQVENGKVVKCKKPSELIKKETGLKHKYIYPLCKSMLPLCRQLAKPYPKKELEVHMVEHLTTSQEVGGSSPTPAL